MNIAQHIKACREAKGISLRELTYASGIASTLIDAYENGTQVPSVSDILRIATALGTDIYALITGHAYNEHPTTVTREAERPKVTRHGKIGYETLAPLAISKHMEPFVVEIPSAGEHEVEISSHPGEEFHYVLEGTLHVCVGDECHTLNTGDTIYFDSANPHRLSGIGGTAKVLAVIYNGQSIENTLRSPMMRQLTRAARLAEGKRIAIVQPDETSLNAVVRALDEEIIEAAYLAGNREFCEGFLAGAPRFADKMLPVEIPADSSPAAVAVALVKEGKAHMLMKGNINTADFTRAVLDKQNGVGTGRRLSLVSIFELPGLDRLLLLTDPGINPALVRGDDVATAVDIIENGISVARAVGINRPKVALMDANEVPSKSIPSTIAEQELSNMPWDNADVYGPLSYDLALYPEAVKKKGIKGNPVAGQADVLVVPHIEGGNFLYKAWVMTMGAEVANIVAGAAAPIIITSRSDSDTTKFLTICTATLFSEFMKNQKS